MFRCATILAVATSLSMIAPTRCSVAQEAAWSGWLGPNRDGWVHNFDPPKSWPAALEQVWRADVGAGYGTPLVAGGRIYQHARQGEAEVLWCLDEATAEPIWRREYTVSFKIGGGGERHGKGPKSSPVLAAGRIFTLSIAGTLSAWAADSGDLLWRRDYHSRFDRSHPYWGVATSPIVVGNRVIVHFGNDDAGVLVALDTASGDELWTNDQDAPSYSSPLVGELDGVRQLIEWNHRALVGVDLETGQQLWEYPFPHVGRNQNMPTPTIHADTVIVGGENRGIHAVRPRRSGPRWEVNELWHQDQLALDMSSAVINDGLLYGFSHYDRGRLFCLDPVSGQVVWTGPPRAGENVAFLAMPGYVAALLNDGQLKLIAAGRDKLEVANSYQLSDGRTWTHPVFLPDAVLIKDDRYLTRWSLR